MLVSSQENQTEFKSITKVDPHNRIKGKFLGNGVTENINNQTKYNSYKGKG